MLNSIADKVLAYRCKYILTQAEMAKLCGVSTATINAIEAERHNLSKLTVAKIMNFISATESGEKKLEEG